MKFIPVGMGFAIFFHMALLSCNARADNTFESMVREYSDGDGTTVTTPHVQMTSNINKDSVEIGAGYAEDIVTSASTDVRSWSSSGKISDTRREESVHTTFNLQDGSVTAAFVESDENDYHSHTYTTRDFFEKNTTLDLGVSLGDNHIQHSHVPSFDAVMQTENITVGVTQVLSPISIGQILYDFTIEDGYLSMPYRVARLFQPDGTVIGIAENSPDTRNRQSLAFKYNYYSRRLVSSFATSIRGYLDNWDVSSGTFEERWSKDYNKKISMSVNARAYYQSEANFYKDKYDPNNLPVFFTGNKTLSNYYTVLIGLRPTFHFGKQWDAYAKLEYYVEHFNNFTDVGNPLDPTDDKLYTLNAFVYGAGLSGKF